MGYAGAAKQKFPVKHSSLEFFLAVVGNGYMFL